MHWSCFWCKNSDKVLGKEAKCEIYAMLRILEERSEKLCENFLQNFLKHLDNRGYKEFEQFIISSYSAVGFSHTSMALEALHKTLKQLYSKSC